MKYSAENLRKISNGIRYNNYLNYLCDNNSPEEGIIVL